MIRFVAFDLDGVLYSAEPFLGEAYREAIALANERRPGSFPYVPTTREILDHVGWPVPVILARLFPDVGPEALAVMFDVTLAVICAHVERGEGELYPEVVTTLERLRQAGLQLGVASNGRRPYVEAVLRRHDLASFFVALEANDVDHPRAKVALLDAYLQRYGLAPHEVVMVGDRASDVEAAQGVGTAFIGCDYGYGYRHELEGAGPILPRLAELPEMIATLSRQPSSR